MIWVMVLTFLGTGDPAMDGKHFILAKAESQAICEKAITVLVEKHGQPPGKSTIECKQVEADQPKE
jgi:hypothetical protein